MNLKTISIGKGSPKTLVVSGLHGDERSGQLVISALLEKLPKFKGSLTILPVANPKAFVANTREEPTSGKDLNRQFLDRPSDPILARSIEKLALQHDFVIDIHNYKTFGLVQGGLSCVGKNEFAIQGSLRMLESLNPQVIRAGGYGSAKIEQGKDGTLLKYLSRKGIPAILIELPQLEKITEKEITLVTKGIKKHLAMAPKYGPSFKFKNLHRISFVRMKFLKTEILGIFERNLSLKLGVPIKKGATVGSITNLTNQKPVLIKCPTNGMICEMETESHDVVNIGETILGIGELLSKKERPSF